MLRMKNQADQKTQNVRKKAHRAKMQSIFDVYFEHKLAEQLKKYYA